MNLITTYRRRRPIGDSRGLVLGPYLCYHCPRPHRRGWWPPHSFGSPLVVASFCFAYVVFSLPWLSCRACSSWRAATLRRVRGPTARRRCKDVSRSGSSGRPARETGMWLLTVDVHD